jgi:hypothetical protein
MTRKQVVPPCQSLAGIDASHYDGLLSPAILAQAKREGISFFTHKIGEGLRDTEGTNDDTALAAARSAGIELLGGYLVVRSNASVDAQVSYWLSLADAGEPWWQDHPGWFWQVDLERWSYDNVPPSFGVAAARQLRERTGRWTVLYASHGQYGDALTGWDGPLWNADYVSRPAAGFTQMYPGDGWVPLHGSWQGGWASYSGKTPTFLQYTDSATIAGLTTCDANAFRGSTAELRALIIGGHMTTLDDSVVCPDGVSRSTALLAQEAGSIALTGKTLGHGIPPWAADITATRTDLATLAATVNSLRTAIDGLTALINAGGGHVDTTAVLARIGSVAAEVSAVHTELTATKAVLTATTADLAAARDEVHLLRTQLAAATKAEAAALEVGN